MHEINTNLLEMKFPGLSKVFSEALLNVKDQQGDLVCEIKKDSVSEVFPCLKSLDGFKFDMLMDLFGMDYEKFPEEMPERFSVIYHLYSMRHHHRLFVRVFLPESDPTVASLCSIYPAANWFERQTWDLYGIRFEGHPNLIRILCHHDFEGHPLRKDYPATRYQSVKTALPSSGL